ncbi:GNAT family N-acetyltransferase [Rossellomorea oryzaecorticis]|uniref:GNAT family N-acetyltransferase n=1 Tax=Rossellomorea oryzaecorticis TaxID=1396505 RepID=A0ABW8VP45_9BACI
MNCRERRRHDWIPFCAWRFCSKEETFGYLVAGILKEYRGQGAGTLLFQAVEEWAVIHGISRLELTAVTRNTPGIALYKKCGFQVEGTKRNSLIINGDYHDEYYMSKLLIR